ncbi:hypothetical protein [Algisphaera agarilytica]|uniref:Ice-binding protein C-terminal domain-containing protein n=1 Tax=Algisphaera agarilytica TaxID=1385975 RepID=A0A7X0H8L8_9BACT|nr:hypothetical protein [Algisphaera agarilytica]MBB6430116.1 hypothetical protein [Algisphaera agarilytica]
MKNTSFALLCFAGSALAFTSPSSHAAAFVDEVISYTPGSGVGSYTNPDAALGQPGDNTGFGLLTPFNPHFSTSELARIGSGGELTLRFSNEVLIGDGLDIGIYTNVFLINNSSLTGAQDPAASFGGDSVDIHVSDNGNDWVSVDTSTIPFNLPHTYYLNPEALTGSSSTVPSNPILADFGKPFDAELSDFDGLTYAGIGNLLDGSAGGTWLDLSPTGLSSVSYIRFNNPGATFELDTVAIANSKVGVLVPEPHSVMGLAATGLLVFQRRRSA